MSKNKHNNNYVPFEDSNTEKEKSFFADPIIPDEEIKEEISEEVIAVEKAEPEIKEVEPEKPVYVKPASKKEKGKVRTILPNGLVVVTKADGINILVPNNNYVAGQEIEI